MDDITKQIAQYATAMSFDQLDAATVHAATQHLIDTLACGIGAHDCMSAQIGRRLAAGETAGKYAGRVLFHGERVTGESAAFINTAMIRNFDFNDRWPGGHPSDALGALLGFAGARQVDGKRFLAGMVVMYELFTRLCDATRLSHRGWDQGFAVSLCVAAGICNLLRLTLAETANAIGIAASASVPLRVTRSGALTPWKGAATAYAARNGLFAACLAAEGMAGPPRAFDGRDGLFDNVTGPFTLTAFPTEGGPSLVPRVELKYWPVEANAQPAVWAALQLRSLLQIDQIRAIEVFTNRFTHFEIGSERAKWDPQTRETADHSLPYILARALVDGPITLRSFDDDKVRDPGLRPLMDKIKVTVDEALEALAPTMAMRVVATMADGREHGCTIVDPKGQPGNPMGDADIADKFATLAAPALGEARCRQALDRWWQVRDARDMAGPIGLLDLPRRG